MLHCASDIRGNPYKLEGSEGEIPLLSFNIVNFDEACINVIDQPCFALSPDESSQLHDIVAKIVGEFEQPHRTF